MKIVWSTCLAAALLASNCFCQESLENDPQVEARAAIVTAARAYESAFHSQHAEKLSQLWSETANYVLPETGEVLVGRAAIEEMFAAKFSDSEPAKLSIAVESIRFISDNVAIESGTARLIEGDGHVSLTKYSAIHVKQNDQWLLDSISDTEILADPSSSSPLNDLEWMVGEWVDASEDSTIETVCHWTTNKKYLTRNFRVVTSDADELEGTQVVGWDPITRCVKSWVFDSDGGFSEGRWSKKGTSWVVESGGYTADGQTVASIQVFSGVDADSFHWQSFGRRVGDERLPDIDDVKVIRKN